MYAVLTFLTFAILSRGSQSAIIIHGRSKMVTRDIRMAGAALVLALVGHCRAWTTQQRISSFSTRRASRGAGKGFQGRDKTMSPLCCQERNSRLKMEL